jgi:hypothetical protein
VISAVNPMQIGLPLMGGKSYDRHGKWSYVKPLDAGAFCNYRYSNRRYKTDG